MNKTVMSVAALALVGAGVFAFAQTQTPPEPELATPGPGVPGMAGMLSSAEDRAILLDARIAAFKAVLKLTPDQEKLWEPVEAFVRKAAAERAKETRERFGQAGDGGGQGFDPIARLRKHADRMTERAGFLRAFADIAAPLYASLSDDQKRRALLLIRRARASMMAIRRHGLKRDLMGPEILDWQG